MVFGWGNFILPTFLAASFQVGGCLQQIPSIHVYKLRQYDNV